MDNAFFEFVETYWDDIAAFLNALRDWVTAIIEKMNGSTEDAE